MEKLNRGIKRYKRMLQFAKGAVHIAEIEFGIADMMITRDDPYDWREAARLYNDILERTPYGLLRGAAMAGKAELVIRKSDKAEIAEAIELADQAHAMLKQFMGEQDFFTLKALVVEAELRLKRNAKGDTARAIALFDKTVKYGKDHPYWQARAMIGLAENQPSKTVPARIGLCQKAMTLLSDRPHDYFYLKARLLECELRYQRGTTSDKKYAYPSLAKVAQDGADIASLKARALLGMAEHTTRATALSLIQKVKEIGDLEPYFHDRAQALEETLTAPKGKPASAGKKSK